MKLVYTLKQLILLLSIIIYSSSYSDTGCKVVTYGSILITSCMVIGGTLGGTLFCSKPTDATSCAGTVFVGIAAGLGASQVITCIGACVIGLMRCNSGGC